MLHKFENIAHIDTQHYKLQASCSVDAINCYGVTAPLNITRSYKQLEKDTTLYK